MLVVGILQVANNDRAGGNQNEFFQIWVQVHRIQNFARVADGVIQFDLLRGGWLLLAKVSILYVRLNRGKVSGGGLRVLLLAGGHLLHHLLI